MVKKEITYSIGRTIQIVQFNPINFHASIKAELTAKDNVEKCFVELKFEVEKQINADVKKAIEGKKEMQKPKGFTCSLCGGKMLRSKAGNLYCEDTYKDYLNNPHKSKTEPDPNIKKFTESLK